MDASELEVLLAARQSAVIKLKGGFTSDTTPTDVADLLWGIGLNVDPLMITIAPHTSPFVTVVINRASLADYIQRCFDAAGQQIMVEPSNYGLKKSR